MVVFRYFISDKNIILFITKVDLMIIKKKIRYDKKRLIKEKTLTEQECKTRVTTYLNAGKITDEQAEELMLLIDEVYA